MINAADARRNNIKVFDDIITYCYQQIRIASEEHFETDMFIITDGVWGSYGVFSKYFKTKYDEKLKIDCFDEDCELYNKLKNHLERRGYKVWIESKLEEGEPIGDGCFRDRYTYSVIKVNWALDYNDLNLYYNHIGIFSNEQRIRK